MHRQRTPILVAVFALLLTVLSPAAAATAQAANTVRTFEEDAVGAVPAGCAAPAGGTAAVVSDVRAAAGAHSLRLNDQSTATTVGITCPDTARQGVDLSFAAYPAQLTNGFSYSLLGHLEGIDTERSVLHLSVTPEGALRWYDGLGWTQLTPAGTVPVNEWSTLRVQVPSSQEAAYLYVDDRYVGEAGSWGVRAVTDVTGFQITGNGTETAGDEVFVDDVSIGDAVDTPPARTQPFTVGPDVTIATSDTHVQMPNTAVNVTVDGQQQTLVAYPTHGDANDVGGTGMAVSTDKGTTWSDAQSRNPMPEAHSYGMTKLANGDILAVGYQTYMTPNSGERSAEVPTAISHDNGLTWTRRAGVMTTPEAMRPINNVTDRPGSPLGGFVLVHNVVQNPDGSLLQSGYGYYANDTKFRQIVLRSTDGGVNWELLTTVAYDPGLSPEPRYEGFDEGAIERTANGDLLIVMRTGSFQQMYSARSADDGATWSAPEPVLADSIPVTGIYPTLTRLASGELALWIGRPGQALLVSRDGTGNSWTPPQTVDYRNSGNGTFVPVDDDHLLTFGDRGADWADPKPLESRVWSRLVTINR
ncbi:hypothetical protein CFN78_04270 [Amycolatopsis antarctica]|uniref:Sialidase domain-containing protein n=1 Tax=Amycolatopsis antarctica TaxID=1854586 RepID=A0A263DAE9_9PSEU|nr:sialidase family protein [Amycolatopsis antarctica]OZM74355.1 hypothetical protein CFN78_04270 [Amycolatopsis antarctica]